jgi:D-glycerate 3-kinase
VYKWRQEQEEKLIETLSDMDLEAGQTMDANALRHFIQHYQRITEHLFETAPLKANILFELDQNRKIICT